MRVPKGEAIVVEMTGDGGSTEWHVFNIRGYGRDWLLGMAR